MRTSRPRSLPLATVIAVTSALGLGAFTGTASASSQAAAATLAQPENCAIVLAPLQARQTTSRVISQNCSSQSPASAAPAGWQKIWTGYQYANYKGAVVNFYAKSPCGNRGYAFNSRVSGWGISSWQAHASCWRTTVFYHAGANSRPYFTYKQGEWKAARIGKPFNDHVWSVWTRR